jgi:hypothetical protein
MRHVLEKNTGYKAMSSIPRVLMVEEFSITEIREEVLLDAGACN